MDNTIKMPMGRRLSQFKTRQELFKISDALLSNIDDFSNSNNQLPQQGKDINALSAYYNKKAGNGNFMEKISRLNKKFYNCSDKFVKSKKMLDKLNDDLYLNLFQQINCYVEEIERLNKRLSSNNNQEFKKTIDQLNKEISEKKEKIRHYENKIREKTNNEEKLMKEIESYKRRIIFYKDKIKIGLLVRNTNTLKSLGRETSINNKKSFSKNKPKYLSPIPDKKTKKFENKNSRDNNKELSLKLDEDNINNKIESEGSNKDNILHIGEIDNLNILNIGGEIKKVNKSFKTKESIYFDRDRDSRFLFNRTDYDIYGKDFEEQEKEDKNLNNDVKLSGNNSGFLNDLAKELYGSPENGKNTIESDRVNSDFFNKNSSYEVASEKKNNKDIEKDEKNKTFSRNTKSRVTGNNNKTIKLSNKKEGIRSKIFNKQNNYKNNLTIDTNSNNKYKQLKTTTNSRRKIPNKSIEKISSFSEVRRKQFKNKTVKEKDKNISYQAGTESQRSLQYNTNTSSYKRRGSGIKKADISRISNKYSNTIDNSTKTNKNNNASNLNTVKGKERYNISSKNNASKKGNDKELFSILIDVNDDYLKNIEMLRKQEDLIKHLLKDIDLEE